ncbi:LysR family transcriptional regulator [Cupriavidus sp. UYPR2.512]|uniref:LysR family transcriptional regulator n=1 Tax=Cupriavidus sp. UYPR2.512 TaxID=1080187 RepID=UPI0003634D27|nr:LysR family transcriptional regulator [Cupriavidus sp. UYPR2.512]UIF89972.1 LysR family transcriptional regulator [Cupriavidus necator]
MQTIEIRHLRYFIAVAEARSIVAAARTLSIVQPALSRQIKDLESYIGAPLFVRHAKGVRLTPAGLSFLNDAKQLLRNTLEARDRAHRIGQGLGGTLKIGALPNYLVLPETLAILKDFREHQADVVLSVEPMLSLQQAQSIRSGELDGGILAFRSKDDPSLQGIRLLREGFVLAMPAMIKNSRIAPKKLADVAAEKFIWFSRDRSAPQHDALIADCAKAGFVPHIAQIGADIPTMLGLVAAGMGYAFVPASTRTACPPSVDLLPLSGLDTEFDVEFVYSRDAESPPVDRFVASVRKVLGGHP